MPISPLMLQRRHAELGRIRLGEKIPVGTNGKSRPAKLQAFRFTSPSERHIRDLAQLYGGEAKAWDNAGKAEWEVFTQAKTIPVIVVKGGLSQWMEAWSGGGCQRRCDGVREMLTDSPCLCEAEDRGERLCKPTTRLSVMLRALDAIGVWRMESHGWNAAAELPGVADLAQYVGELVPANLTLHERVTIRDGKTSRFVVPGLDLEIAPAQLAALVTGQTAAAVGGDGEAKAITPGPAAPDYLAELEQVTSVEDCSALWRQAGSAGHLSDELKAAITAKAGTFQILGSAPEAAASPASGADLGLDVDALWVQVVAEAGRLGMDDPTLRAELVKVTGATAEDATTEQLGVFLHALTTGEVVGVAS